jgi:hypothetical protein
MTVVHGVQEVQTGSGGSGSGSGFKAEPQNLLEPIEPFELREPIS